MKPSQNPKIRKRCASCGSFFSPEPRAAGRQWYCGKTACRAVSKRESQRRWSRSPAGESYHSGEEGKHRVCDWRAAHPGYSRRKVCEGGEVPGAVYGLREVIEGLLSRDTCGALQDSWPPCIVVLVGLVARLGGGSETPALQDAIARDFREIIVEGNAILAAQTPPGRRAGLPRSLRPD